MESTRGHSCSSCAELGEDKVFNSKAALKKHERQSHGLATISFPAVCCPLCDHSSSRAELREHYERDHGYYLEREVKDFYSTAEFDEWKAEVERSTGSEYVRRRPPYTMSDGTERIIYSCSRDGTARTRAGERRKVSCHCPAEMRLSVTDELILVEWSMTHVGHATGPSRPSRSTTGGDVLTIDGLVENVKTFESDCSSGDIVGEPVGRFPVYLIDQPPPRQRVDLKSWAEQMNAQKNIVRYLKQQGDEPAEDSGLQEDDFVVVLFNDAMLGLLNKFGPECVCVDRIKVTRDAYELTTVLVVDEFKQGLPVAFLLSNRTDFLVAKIFFETIKTAGVEVETKLFMSEIGVMFCSAWSAVMPPVKIILYSSWHVDAAWRENLKTINDESKRTEVYKKLQLTMDELDEATFNAMFENVCRSLMEDHATLEFGNYFIDNFGSSAILWASCCRKTIGLNPKLSLERSHKTIEHFCNEGKNVKPLDKAAQDLMVFARDKLIDRLTQRERPSHKLKDLKNRHEKIKQLANCRLSQVGDEWVISSPSSANVARLTPNNLSCQCALKCVLCHMCAHNYVCSCSDSWIKWNMCKHIHFLCEHLNSANGGSKADVGGESLLVTNRGSLCVEIAAEKKLTTLQSNDDLQGVANAAGRVQSRGSTEAKVNVEPNPLFAYKRKVKEALMTLIRRVDNVKTLEDIKIYDEVISPVIPVINGLTKNSGKSKAVKSEPTTPSKSTTTPPLECRLPKSTDSPSSTSPTTRYIYVPVGPTSKKLKICSAPSKLGFIVKSGSQIDATAARPSSPAPVKSGVVELVFQGDVPVIDSEELPYAEEVVLL